MKIFSIFKKKKREENFSGFDNDYQNSELSNGMVKGKVFISYKRNKNPDEPLANRIYKSLSQEGFKPFIDKTMAVGVNWGNEIDRQLRSSEFLLVLLSPSSVNSDMVAEEVLLADQLYKLNGYPKILPVKVNFNEPFPYRIAPYLRHIQYAEWNGHQDTENVISMLINAVQGNSEQVLVDKSEEDSQKHLESISEVNEKECPLPNFDPRVLDTPSGAVKLKSKFYIRRDCDTALERQIMAGGNTTTIRAGRQMGKTSLMIRGAQLAKARGYKVVYLDFQAVQDCTLETLDSLLDCMATKIMDDLRLDPFEKDEIWKLNRAPLDKIRILFEDVVLVKGFPVLLAIDEADRLLDKPYKTEFFAMLRAWDTLRAHNELWENFSVILIISTHPHLLIEDHRQSPFNVGLKLYLEDFSYEQISDLNERYGSPINDDEIQEMMKLLGGHPFLIRQALYTIVSEEMYSWNEFSKIALNEMGPFSSHLHFYLWQLRDHPKLVSGLKEIMKTNTCSDEQILYRLSAAGLTKELSNDEAAIRCGLYENYFKQTLYD